jgi:type IX secretion system PorP/SprF family membrane protein
MAVNPGYTGQREALSITGLYRAQWVGLEGAPQSQTFSIHSPLRNKKFGLGLSVVNDALGPVNETMIDANFSYTIRLNKAKTKLSFGAKAGLQMLNTDWSKGNVQNPDVVYDQNVSLLSPTVGTGLYLHNRKWYVGVSVPNVLQQFHYSDAIASRAQERINYYLIAGYVFDIGTKHKFKPAALVKAVSGAPIVVDVSANFLLNDQFALGVAWRWDDAVSALLGYQFKSGFYLGYSYDFTTTQLTKYNSGSHEVLLRYELRKAKRLLSPRFF